MLLRRLERLHTVIDRRMSVIARMDGKVDAAKKNVKNAAGNPSLIVRNVDEAPTGSTSQEQLDRDAQLILDYGAQRVEAARSLVELLNQAEMEIMKEIRETESSLAESRKLRYTPINRDVPYQNLGPTEDRFCICRGGANVSDMVQCDNPMCPFQWFHIECVGLDANDYKQVKPGQTWFCPWCTALMRHQNVQVIPEEPCELDTSE